MDLDTDHLADSGLRIDTSLDSAALSRDIAGSQEVTPRAGARPELPAFPASADEHGQPSRRVEPEPVEPMSKDRSSYLLYSTPSSVGSDKTAASEGIAQGPCASRSARKLGVRDALPNIAEDLASADEHFSDAPEGRPEDAFEARDRAAGPVAQEQPVDEPPRQEATLTVTEDQDLPETTASTATEDAEPAEWKTMTAKDKRKVKKARKWLGLSVGAAGAVAAAAVSALAQDSESNQDTAPSRSDLSQDDLEQPKKGRNGRKKSLLRDGDLGETPAQSNAGESLSVACRGSWHFSDERRVLGDACRGL